MNENLDVRMSNYLKILSDPELIRNFPADVIRRLEQAVVIYANQTSKKFIDSTRSYSEEDIDREFDKEFEEPMQPHM